MSDEQTTPAAEELGTVEMAILHVMERVEYIQKESSPQLRYTFAGEAGLIRALRPEMVAAGLFVHVTDVHVAHRGEYRTSKGSTMQACVITAKGRIVHAPSGTYIDVCAIGEGADVGDKSSPKAMTGAYKYILRETFCLETGDDPDKDASVDRAGSNANPPGQGQRPPQQRQQGQQQGGGGQGDDGYYSAPPSNGGGNDTSWPVGSKTKCSGCSNEGTRNDRWRPGTRIPDMTCLNGGPACVREYQGKMEPNCWWSEAR